MIGPCKVILKQLQLISCHTGNVLSFSFDAPCIQCVVTGKAFNYSHSKYKDQIDTLIDALADSGHIVYTDHSHFNFSLTARGLHPYLFRWEDVKSFIFRSILTPIVVAAITAVVTTLITLALS